jgi:hypothetical protein
MNMQKYESSEPERRKLLRPAEFAESIGISKRRCQNLLSARRIPGAVKIPGVGWRVNLDLFVRLCSENAVVPKWSREGTR